MIMSAPNLSLYCYTIQTMAVLAYRSVHSVVTKSTKMRSQ